MKNTFICLAAVILLSTTVFAKELIQLPLEELARESVSPVFDINDSVRNRNIVTQKKYEGSVFYGWSLTEPIANVSKIGLSGYYHPSEDDAYGLMFIKNFSGVSYYAKQLFDQYKLDFTRAPSPEASLFFDYNLKAFYGKMSLSKNTVTNYHFFGSLAGGIIKYSHKTYPAIATGLGQKFYFNKKLSFRFDFRIFLNQAPIPFLKCEPGKHEGIKNSTADSCNEPAPKFSDFDERFTITSVIDLGISYLF
ncbi:MAG: outer membrane beta-barrel domain-containing protein [Bdellovibrionaceae bacterium]|nr:outer membrane beta-barrel domain-containing protein [Pseudobdellovibrionaceae bacterium]